MSILVIAEPGESVSPATLKAVGAALKIGGPVSILLAGSNLATRAAAHARIGQVETVLVADATAYGHGLAEPLAALACGLGGSFTHVLAPATSFGKNVIPRLAALLDVQPLSDVCAIESAEVFVRPIYAGNALATIRSQDRIKILTVRVTAFDPASAEGGHAEIKTLETAPEPTGARFVSQALSQTVRPELTAARIVISGGRGMQSADNFRLLEAVADKLGAAIGASRAAVDAGFAPNDLQVGQTGKIVAPELYIAVGISGAIQHLAGMKDSKVIVAINKDEDAPIFQVADYGLVDDLFKALPQLSELLG